MARDHAGAPPAWCIAALTFILASGIAHGFEPEDVHMFHLKPDMKMSAAGLANVNWTITLETQYESEVTDDVTREEFCAYECHLMYPSCHAFNVDYVSGNCTLMSSDIDLENLVYDMDFTFFLGLDGDNNSDKANLEAWDAGNRFSGGTLAGLTNVCDWTWVTCSHDRVTALDVSNAGLEGDLDPNGDLAGLQALRKLDLRNNNLFGTLPFSYVNMKNLEILDLSENSISGTLPPTWATSFSGELVILNLASNILSGALPPFSDASGLQNLEVLSLCTNNFTGPLPNIELGDLHELGICDNMVTGTLPGAWAETLPQLHVMRLDDNYIQGSIPGEWMNSTLFQTLHVMDVCHNSLEGPLPPGLTELNALSVLSLCNNYFNETLPLEWSNFTALRSLDVCRNDLTGSVPLSYSQLYIAGLESLSACANNLSGDVSDVLMGTVNGPQVNLTVLDLSANGYTGTLPVNIFSTFTNIEHIDLSLNNINGTLPIEWSYPSPSLRSLILADNDLVANLSTVMNGLVLDLEVLDLSRNDLYGTLPILYSTPTSLVHLKLEDANIFGTLPESWTEMQGILEHLELSGNSLTGTIPDSYVNFTSIVTLDLSFNQLTGTLPSFGEWDLWYLEVLNFSNNDLNGTFPCSLTGLYLFDLLLGNNSMTGEFPDPAFVYEWEHTNVEFEGGLFTNLSSTVCSRNFTNETIVVSFDVHLPYVNPADIWDIAADYVRIVATAAGLPAEHVKFRFNDTTGSGVTFGTDVILVVDYDGAEDHWFDTFIDQLDPNTALNVPILDDLNHEFTSYSVSNIATEFFDGLPDNTGSGSAQLQQPGYWEQFLAITHIISSTMHFPSANTSHVTELANLYLNATAAFAGLELERVVLQGILHDPAEGGLRITSDVVFPEHQVPIIPPPPSEPGRRRMLQTGSVNYTATSQSLQLALSSSPSSIYPASSFSTYGSPVAATGSQVQAAAHRGGAAAAHTQPHPAGHYNTVNFADSSIFTIGAATPATPAPTAGSLPPSTPLHDVIVHGGVEFPDADYDYDLFPLMEFVLSSVVSFAGLANRGYIDVTGISAFDQGGIEVWLDVKFYNVDMSVTQELENAFNSNPSAIFDPMNFGSPYLPPMYTADSTILAPGEAASPHGPTWWDMYDWADLVMFYGSESPAGDNSHDSSNYYSSYASSGSMGPTQAVTWIVSFTVAFPGATKDDLPVLGPLYVQRVAEAAGNLIKERVHIFMYELQNGGIEFSTEVVYPTTQSSNPGRKLLQASPDWATAVANLKQDLESNIGAVFPAQVFGAYGPAVLPQQNSLVMDHAHIGPPENWMQPLASGTYDQNNYDWLNPDIFTSFASTSSGSGSSSLGPFQEYTLVVKFDIALLDYSPDDWPFVGRDLIMIISNLFGVMDDNIKIREIEDQMLKLGVTVILPVYFQADEEWLRDHIANLDNDMAFTPSLATELRNSFGKFQVANVVEADYTGMPGDQGMPQDAVPHPPGFWMDYWMSMDDDSSGSGSGSYVSQEETLVISFRVALYDYGSEDWLTVGRDFLQIVSNVIGEADDHIKVRELYDSPSLTLDVSVIKPLWSQMDYDMIRMNFLDNLDTDEAMFPALRELETFGQFRVWEVREERFFGLPWDEGMPQQAVPHPPMYWADYLQDQGGSMGSSGSSLGQTYWQDITLTVRFTVFFPFAFTESIASLGPIFISSVADAAGGIDVEYVKIHFVEYEDPGLLFETEVILPSFVKEMFLRRKLQQSFPPASPDGMAGQVSDDEYWYAVAHDLADTLQGDIGQVFPAQLFAEYGSASLRGEPWVDEQYQAVMPLPPGTYDPGMFDWEDLANGGVIIGPPGGMLDSFGSFEYMGSDEYMGSYGYIEYEPDYGYEPEQYDPDTTTIVIEFSVAFMYSSSCDLLNNTVGRSFLTWYRDSLVDYIDAERLLPPGFMLDEYSVKVTASLGVGLGVHGERGACDVPFVLFTEIAMPSFVPAEQNEFAIRFAVDSLRPVLNSRISSILEVKEHQCLIPECGDPSFAITITPMEAYEMINPAGALFTFGVPDRQLLSVDINLDIFDPDTDSSMDHSSMDWSPIDYGSLDSWPGDFGGSWDFGSFDSMGPIGPGPGPGPGAEGPTDPGLPTDPVGPTDPMGPTDPSPMIEVETVAIIISFPEIFLGIERPPSPGMDSFLQSLYAAVENVAGVPGEHIIKYGYPVGEQGWEIAFTIYFMPEPIGRRKLLQNSPALDFVDMAMSGGLAQALTQQLDTVGVQVPGAMIISEDPVVTVQTVDPSNPTAGVSDPGADSYYFYEYEYTYDYGSEEYGGMIGGSGGDMGPMEPIPGEPGPGPERPGPGSEPEDLMPPVDEDYDGSMAFMTEPPPAIEIVPYIPLVTLRMTFQGFTVQDLSLIPGAGNAFCSFFRELISDMAVVEWSDIQIKGISPGQTPEPSVEVFSRVRFNVLEIEKLEEERGADFPTEETAPQFYDTRAVSILDQISILDGQLPKANLLKWMWTFNRLPLGTISVKEAKLPSGGYWINPKPRGWWTVEQLDEIWGDEAILCGDTAVPEPTEEPDVVPPQTPDAFDNFFNEPVEQDLEKDLQNVMGLSDVDVSALLQADIVVPNLVVNSAEDQDPTGPDILENLNIQLPLDLVVPVSQTPAPPPKFMVDFGMLEVTEEEEEEDKFEEPDTTPPVCRPADGNESPITMYMFSNDFKDPGASCVDDGQLMPVIMATTVQFRDADGTWKNGKIESSLGVEMEYRMIYRNTDAAGNVSPDLVRQVFVRDPCKIRTPPTEVCVKETKDSLREGNPSIVCSVPNLDTKVCDMSLLTFIEEPEETIVVEEEVVDEEPPSIELNLGDGQVQETQLADGSTLSVIVHQYVVTRDENIWSDPGWTVVDNFDPPTSIKKSAQGAGAVTTAYPTQTPYSIRYSATDTANNKSPDAIRLINVICPEGEKICDEEPDEDFPKCSIQNAAGVQQCGDGADSLADLKALGLSTSTDAAADDSADTGESFLVNEEVVKVEEPSIQLTCGPDVVIIKDAQDAYTACPTGEDRGPNGEVCDSGCTAFDGPNGDGVISDLVEACTNEGTTTKRYFSKLGVSKCDADVTEIGKYTITFCAETKRPNSRVCQERLVTVQPACEAGETVCEDGRTCSVDGQCVLELGDSLTFGVDDATIDTVVDIRLSPVVTLRGSAFVALKRGTKYRKCNWEDPDDVPTEDDPCDLGANATDHDFDDVLVDVSDKVLVCPPESCLMQDTGCSGFEFASSAKGKPGEPLICAAIDEMAEVGTTIELKYMVQDFVYPGAVSSTIITRTITIAEPCGQDEFFCEDDRTCSSIACDQRGLVIQEEVEDKLPVVRLNGEAIVRAAYGQPLGQQLGFCQALDDTDCGAYAVAEVDGESVIPTDTVILSSGCLPADAEQGNCLPGAYALKYKAYDALGRESNTASRILIVEQRATVEVGITLPLQGIQDEIAAEAIAEEYRQNDFKNDLTDIVISAFVQAYGDGNADINADTASVSRVIAVLGSGGFVLEVTVQVQVSSTAIDDGTDDASSSTSTPTPTPAAQGISSTSTLTPIPAAEGSSATSTPAPTAGRRHLLAHSGRHLLQTGTLSSKLDGVLSGLSAGDSNAFSETVSLQAQEAGLDIPLPVVDDSPPVTESTTPKVDVLGGLITNLAASVESYQERQVSLAFRLNAVLADASKAAGDGETDADSVRASEFRKAFQLLLRDYNGVTNQQSGNLTAVLKMFDEQLARQLALNAGLSATMEAIQEGLATQQRFLKGIVTTQVFLQTVIGPGWDGTGSPPACPQAAEQGEHVVEFQVTYTDTADVSEEIKRRRLLAAGGGGGRAGAGFSDTESLDITDEYFGYRVAAFEEDTRAYSLFGKGGLVRDRFIGGPDRNRVIGGVLVHLKRADVNTSYCDLPTEGPFGGALPGPKFIKLSRSCEERRFLQTLGDNGTYFTQWNEIMNNKTHPYGSDPMWIRSSGLFDESMGGAEGNFYNMSEGSKEVNVLSNMMYAHFPREMPGRELGFPLYVDAALDEIRLAQMLVYAEDSNYIDKKTQEVTVQMTVYNAQERVFGYGKADISRDVNGVWEQTFEFNGIPAMDFDATTTKGRFRIIGDNMGILCLGLYFVWCLFHVFSHPTIWVQMQRAADRTPDFIIIGAMAGAFFLYYGIIADLLVFSPRTNYDIYDASTFAPARFLLPKKVELEKIVDAEQLLDVSKRMEGKPSDWASDPGLPGRWELPNNETGMEDYGDMLAMVDSVSQKMALYGAVQGIIILVMIFRMLHLWNFQSQVGVVTRTLFKVLPDLGEFGFVLVILMVLYASYGMIVAGANIGQYSNLSDAFYSLFVIIVAGEGGEMHEFAHAPGAEYLTVERLNIDFWYYSVWIFFFFTLTSYLLGYIGYTLAVEKELAGEGDSPMDEISHIFKHVYQSYVKRMPKNTRISRRLEKVLDQIDNDIDVSEVLRKQLKLEADDVVFSVCQMEELGGMKLERNDLEQLFIAAQNRVIAKTRGEKSKASSHNKKADKELISAAAQTVLKDCGSEYTVDPEFVEDHLSNEQYELYSAVLQALKPAYNAAAILWNEHVEELRNLERVSAELHNQVMGLTGISSIPPFKIARPPSAPPSSSLSIKGPIGALEGKGKFARSSSDASGSHLSDSSNLDSHTVSSSGYSDPKLKA